MTAISGRFRVRKWRVCGCWVELYAYRAHFGASGLAPRRHQAQLLSRFRIRFHPSKPSDFYAPLDSTCQHHPFTTPPGVFSWQLDRIAITATIGYGVPCGLPGAPLTAIFYGQGAQQPLAPRLSGVSLASPPILTVSWPQKQDPGNSLGPAQRPFRARRQEEEEKCVCVCVCVCVCIIILFVWLKYLTPVFLYSTCCEVV